MKIAEKLNIPQDISTGGSLLSVTGNHEIYIENYKSIILYDKTCIKVQTKHKKIMMQGKNFEIVYYTDNDMKIIGELDTICYY